MRRHCTVAAAIVLASVAAGSADAQRGSLAGRFENAVGVSVEFDSIGRATFTGPRGVLIVAKFYVFGDSLLLEDESGPAACLNQDGSYLFRLTGDTLRFRLGRDRCEGRRNALSTIWLRKSSALVLRGANVIDGTGSAPKPGMTIVMRDGKVESVVPDSAATVPAFADVRNVNGAWVLPGLIDAHVHLATNPSAQDARSRVERRLYSALRGGVVAVRDMAGDGRALAALARDAAVGDIEAPIIRYSAVVGGPSFFADPRVRASSAGVPVGTAPWARAIYDTTDLRQAVAEARGSGATGIKIYGALDGRTAARVATEAKRQGMRVWAHLALFPARPSEVIASGADAVSHAPLLAWEVGDSMPDMTQRQQYNTSLSADHAAIRRVIEQMRARDVVFEPTLFVFRDDPALPDTSIARRRATLAVEFTRAVYQAGVRIAVGTDGIGGESDTGLPNIHEELALLVERAGLPPMDALIAATRTNADVLGLGASHGIVAAGRAADLLVLRANPLANIRNTRQIAFVVRRGRIVQ